MSRGLITYLYLAILLTENKSDSLSSRSSLEDLLDSYATTVLSISERETHKKRDLYEFFNDLSTTNYKRHSAIFRDDFNVHVENLNKKTKLNFQRDGFPKKLHKDISHFDRQINAKDNDFLVKTKDDRFNNRKSRLLLAVRGPKLTQSVENLKANKHKTKHKRIKPLLRASKVQDTPHLKNFTRLKDSKKSKEYITPKSFSTVVKKLKNKHSRFNKRQQTQNSTDLSNELGESSKISTQKKSELDIALNETEVVLNEKQHKIQNKKRVRKHSTNFVKAKSGSKSKIIKKKSKSDKNEVSFLTMFNLDEEEDTFEANNAPLNRGSPLLDTTPEVSQNKKKKLRSMIIKKSTNAKQQPIEIGMTDENEQYDHLDVDFKSTFEDLKKDVYPVERDKLQSEDTLVIKPKHNIHISKSEKKPLSTDNKSDMKLEFDYKTNNLKQVHPKIAKNDFGVSLKKNNDGQNKSVDIEKKIELNANNASKAELMLADSNESDDTSGDDQTDKEEKNESIVQIFRYSKNKLRGKRSLKKCKKACSEAFSSVCKRIHCSPKAKRDLKHQCKKSCVNTFGERKYSSEK